MAQNVLSISEFEDFNEWKRDGNVIRNSDGSYSTQDANFRNRLEDMEELQRYYKREFVGSYAKGGEISESFLSVNPTFKYQYSVKRWLDDNEYDSLKYKIVVDFLNGEKDIDEKYNIELDRWARILRSLEKIGVESPHENLWRKENYSLGEAENWVKNALNKYFVLKKVKMENMYKIVDIDGDTVESNLNEQEVIEFADSLGYYEAQDNEEEPIYDIDSAISLIEMEGDYTVVKMSEYGGSVYAYGGKVAKVGEPYDSMTKYQLEKEFKKLTEKRDLLKKKYGSYQSDEITEIEKEIDKIITLLYGENFSGVGQKYFYAKGGKVAKFDAYEVAGELAELADGVWDKLGITDGGMLYNDESLQAKVNEEYAKAGIDEMFKALSTVNRKKVAEALTDENNHNVRNYLALRGYLGVVEKRSYTKLFKESGKFKIVLNPTIFGVKPLVSDISTYVPHSKVLSITIKKGDKEYNLTGSDILDGVYVKDGEFKRGGVMKTLRRWWKKLNGTWYYNEGAGWRRDRKFQNKSEKYEKDGRKTYKQIIRGYVDDVPYEFAKGGYVDMREKLTKELMKLQRQLNSHRLSTYIEGDTSEEEMARSRERESKLARFNDILKTLNEMDKSPKYAKGGDVTVPEKIEYSSMFSAIPRSTDNENVV